MLSRVVYKNRRGRRLLTSLAALGLVAGTLLATSSVLAVHDDGIFQLDRNAYVADPGLAAYPAAHDWDQVCPTTAPAGIGGCVGSPGTANSSFDTDPDGKTIYTGGGSKDGIDLPSWQYKAGSVPDKDEIQHAMAARYGDLVYFAADREATNGDSQVGFWFFQSKVLLSNGDAGTFVDSSGNPAVHTNGDLLILSDFTQGGSAPTVRVFKWSTALGTVVPVAGDTSSPADCLGIPAKGRTPAVPPVSVNDPFCATTNLLSTNSPWAFAPKSGAANVYAPGAFYEGGIDLADPSINLAGECFSSFLAETRSSQSVDAVLKDFVLGGFGSCSATLSTLKSGPATFSLGGTSPTDTATINVSSSGSTAPAPAGTVSFFLCGPSATAITVCDTTGLTAFNTQSLTGVVPVGNNYSVTSTAPTITQAGYYCFAASWPGDSHYVGAIRDDGTGECFQVISLQPTLDTAQRFVPNDQAAVNVATSGGALAGTVRFRLYDNATCTPSGTTLYDKTFTLGTDGTVSNGGLRWTVSTDNTTAYTTTKSFSWLVEYASSNTAHKNVTSVCNNENSSITINNGTQSNS